MTSSKFLPRVMPEDLMETVIAADTIRRQMRGEALSPPHPLWKRTWIEPWFNLIGYAFGQVLALLPWPLRWRADQRITQWMGARPSATPPQFETLTRDFTTLARRLYAETGQWPATMIFTSHPTTTGPLEWIRFELFRQGLLLANAVMETTQKGRFYRSNPQCFLAIDPYALDTVPTPVAGLYSGFMHRIYLVWDRQSHTQSWLQRHLLLRGTGYFRIAQRVVSRLKQDSPIVMVLPGGLPQNARLLYAAREFVHGLPVKRWPYPKRLAQKKWMEILIQPVNGVLPCEKGVLPEATRTALRALLSEWGFSDAEQPRWVEIFAREFQGTVPYRARLFRALFRRVVAKGKPLLWAAVAHRGEAPYVQVSSPWGAYRTAPGDLRFVRGVAGRPEVLSDIVQVATDFSKEFLI